MTLIRRKSLLLLIVGTLVVVPLLVLAAWWTEHHLLEPPPPPPSSFDAAWLAHRWVGGELPEEEYMLLAARLARGSIEQVYVHVGPLEGDGSLDPVRHPAAAVFLAAMGRHAPELSVLAWIGQAESRGGGPLDIGIPEVRKRIAAASQGLLDLGFHGIHVNIEPIFDLDERWLALLATLREVTSPVGKLLSIAGDEIAPFPGANELVGLVTPRGGIWSAEFYRAIEQHADEVAVMAYDTALPWDFLFAKAVEWQTRDLVAALPAATRLLIGLPTYDEQRWSFHPEAENLAAGLPGVRRGRNSRPLGVAIYAEWTTEEVEWATLRALWSASTVVP